jgi:large subunit ribosomal protein L6
MSRIGKLPIEIPEGVTIDIKGEFVTVKGPKGELSERIRSNITVKIEGNILTCSKSDETKESKSLHGLSRSLIANMVEGVTKGFVKRLEIIGVGYKANVQGSKLVLNLGFSHPIEIKTPEGITFELDKDKKNILSVSGISKQQVGEIAAKIRSYRKPEPYKGKGIRYEGEYVARKAGKTASKGE